MVATVLPLTPDKIYRYRSLGNLKRELLAIEEGYVYCSKFDDLNDPMEGAYDLNPKDRRGPRSTSVRDKLSSEKQAIGICSFSETHTNEIMWAHYAKEFSGICIEYDFQLLLKKLPSEYKFARISYTENTLLLSNKSATAQEAAERILSHKSYRWLYEREWRLLSPWRGITPLPSGAVSHVYFGRRLKERQHSMLKKMLEKEKIPCSQMSINGYSIRFTSR